MVARWPGSSHDSFIWRFCGLREIFAGGHIPQKNFLLEDSGYPLEPWLMTPYSEERVIQHRNYNRVHQSAGMLLNDALEY